MKNTKKEHNSNNIISWIYTFGFLALVIATIFDDKPTIQTNAVILLMVVLILVVWLNVIQRELYNIKNSLDDLYNIKQINDLRSTVNKRHLEKLLNDMQITWRKNTNEESKH